MEVCGMATRPGIKTTNRPPPAAARGDPLSPILNHLLAALPAADYERLLPSLDLVSLTLKHVLHRPGEPIQHVYFPGGGFCSMLTVLQDGNMVEVATIGREGMVGATAFSDRTPSRAAVIVQAASETCYRMTADAFRLEMNRSGALSELLTRYAEALVGYMMQSTACNAVHSIEQRLARWLLMARDHVGSDNFLLTQENVAMMLGATRPTVTVVAGLLQRDRLIEYHRGHLTILDRQGLEQVSCECYRTVTKLLQSVFEPLPVG
jgi:CRP-like cAMP-binding protein